MVTVIPCHAEDFPVQDNLFQSAFWGRFKNTATQTPHYFFAQFNGIQFPLLILLRETIHGYRYAYAPKAPSLAVPQESYGVLLEQLALAVKPHLPQETVCVRFDLPWASTNDIPSAIRPELRELRMNFGTQTASLRKAPVDHLCPDTVIINLTYSPEQLLARMRQTTRNSIRHAYRSDITFSIQTAAESLAGGTLKAWHSVYQDTATRKSFYFESYDYFEHLFKMSMNEKHLPTPAKTESKSPVPIEASVPSPHFFLLTASKDNILLSGMILATCSHTAYYMYAGSTLENRDLMPNYGLQWEAQLFARRQGCTRYDLMGIPPADDSAHPMHGLYIFKTGFGGDTTHFPGAWDYVYNADAYKTFTTEEQFATALSV